MLQRQMVRDADDQLDETSLLHLSHRIRETVQLWTCRAISYCYTICFRFNLSFLSHGLGISIQPVTGSRSIAADAEAKITIMREIKVPLVSLSKKQL